MLKQVIILEHVRESFIPFIFFRKSPSFPLSNYKGEALLADLFFKSKLLPCKGRMGGI
jgi:hypothetical protein